MDPDCRNLLLPLQQHHNRGSDNTDGCRGYDDDGVVERMWTEMMMDKFNMKDKC